MKRFVWWSACVFPALIVTACGGGMPSGPSGELSEEAAADFVSLGGNRSVELADGDNADGIAALYAADSGTRSLLERTLLGTGRRTERTTCNLVKGSSDNIDKDAIDDNREDTFDCEAGSANITLEVSGKSTLKDRDTTKVFPLGGADVTLALNLGLTLSGSEGSGSVQVSTNGTWGFVLDGTTGKGDVAITQTISASGNGGSFSGEIGWWLTNWEVTPDDVNDFKQKGQASWKSYFQVRAGSAEYTLEGTTNGLKYDRDCPVPPLRGNRAKFNEGYVEWVDGVGNKARVTFAPDCSFEWTYNGTPLP